jgi:DNA-binding MarR family transcriptional regulator
MAKSEKTGKAGPLRTADYLRLASFRHALRRFLQFSESAAAGAGLTAPQHQALLAIRGVPDGTPVTINDLARRLLIKHNSTVGLVDRLVEQGLLGRRPMAEDGRKVRLELTRAGERVLQRLSSAHRAELKRIGPELYRLLGELTGPER